LSTILLVFSLVILGFIAATGFSRILSLLPIIYLGYYLIYAKYFPNPKYFIRIAQILSIVLVLNEIRLTFLILKKKPLSMLQKLIIYLPALNEENHFRGY
jgi:hypothetical protein